MNEQMMLAAIRACATTVDELVATVTALPTTLAEQLAEVRRGVATALNEHATTTGQAMAAIEALRADMGNTAAGLTARLEAMAQAHAETRQIIADNQAAVAGIVKAGVEAGLDPTVFEIEQHIFELKTNMLSEVDSLKAEVGQHTTTLGEKIAEHANNLFDLNALVPKVKAELVEQIVLVGTNLEAATKQFADADVELARVTQVNMDTIVARVDGVESASDQNFESLKNVNARLDEAKAELALNITETVASARANVSGQIDRQTEQFQSYVETELVKVGNRIEELKGAIPADTTDSLRALEVRADAVENTANANFAELRRFVAASIESHSKANNEVFQDLRDEARALVDSNVAPVIANIEEVTAKVNGAIETAAVRDAELRKFVSDEFTVHSKANDEVLQGLREEAKALVDTSVAAVAASVDETRLKLRGSIEIIQRAVEGKAAVEALQDLREEAKALVDSSVAPVVARVEEIEKVVPNIDALDGIVRSMQTSYEQELQAVQDKAATKEQLTAVFEQVGEVRKDVEIVRAIASETTIVDALDDRVKTMEENLGIVLKSVDGRIDGTLRIVDENERKYTEAVQAVQQKLDNGLAEVTGRVEDVTKQVAKLDGDVGDITEYNTMEAPLIREFVKTNVDALRKDFDGVTSEDRKTAAELYEAAINNTEKLRSEMVESVAKLQDDVDGRFEKLASGFDIRASNYDHKLSGIQDSLNQLRNDAVADVGKAIEKATSVALNLDSFMEGIDERFAEFSVKVGNNVAEWTEAFDELRKQVNAEIDGRLEKMLKALDEVPIGVAPEDMAELQVRNAHMVDAQIGTALANMRVETEYEDGVVRLVAVLPRQDGTESRSVVDIPVQLGVRWRQVYLENETYQPGDIVTHKGSMWIAKAGITGEPGTDITGWTLIVKRGTNGRDGHSVRVFETHTEKNLYHEGDFLHWGNRLWQAKKDVRTPPDAAEVHSTEAWTLIGGLQ